MIDLHNMRDRTGLSLWVGTGFVAAMVAVVALVIADFNGVFSGDVRVTAQLPPDGAVVAQHSAVHYHGIKVGTVADAPHPDGNGHTVVDLDLDPDRAARIPASARVAIAPLSVFGNQYVTLVTGAPTGTPTGTGATASAGTGGQGQQGEQGAGAPSRPVADGAVLPAVTAATTPSLQATVTTLDQLLRNIHPAQLNAGLSGMAQALAGRGRSLGQTLVKADKYLTQMLPLWPRLVADMKRFAPFAHNLAGITPEFLDLIQNAGISARTLTRHQRDFTALLDNGAKASAQVAALLRKTARSYADAVAGAQTLLVALAQQPTVIGRLLAGLSRAAKAWRKAIGKATVHVRATLRVTHPASLALAMASGEDLQRLLNEAVVGRFVNPPTYTAADCPRYGKQRGPCGGGR